MADTVPNGWSFTSSAFKGFGYWRHSASEDGWHVTDAGTCLRCHRPYSFSASATAKGKTLDFVTRCDCPEGAPPTTLATVRTTQAAVYEAFSRAGVPTLNK